MRVPLKLLTAAALALSAVELAATAPGKVECQALVFFRETAQGLGASAVQADDLYAYALALAVHQYKVRLFPQYRDPKCVIPPWAPPPGTA